ncbi:MAG TPA: serine/threonine-protein kinase, partial [Kofleriaceae bacterium]|nr:serine/threonine-protein kinase [Kofleriaceae bacterium]
MPTESDTLRRAGRFVLGPLLGRGAHGAVYEASDPAVGQVVAVKIFGDACDPSRIRREIAALRLLRVRGVVQFIEEGIASGQVYLAMERVRGCDFPGGPRPMPWSAMAHTVIALFETLAEVHSAGIVHRDLKPANVLVDAQGRPTVVDFGVSWGANIAPAHTLEGQIIGTPAYLSPEQIRGEPVGTATDLYAAGVMLYEALSGVVPHGGNTVGLFYRRVRDEVTPLLEVAPETPRSVARVVDQLLRNSPIERPRSADLVVALLTQSSGAGAAAIPRLGSRDAAAEVLAALERGLSAVVVGPLGSGRTSVLDEVQRCCAERGRRCVALVPGRLPYASLGPLAAGLLPGDRPGERSLAEGDALAEQ